MIIGVLLPLPFNEPFDYESEEELPLGTMVRVPFGREEQIGVVWRHGKSSGLDRKSTRLNSSHSDRSRMPSSA